MNALGLSNPSLKEAQQKYLPKYLMQGNKYLLNNKKMYTPLIRSMERIY